MNGQLRRSEQLSGRAGVGLCPTWAAPSPSPAHLPGKAERAPSHPSQPLGGPRSGRGAEDAPGAPPPV